MCLQCVSAKCLRLSAALWSTLDWYICKPAPTNPSPPPFAPTYIVALSVDGHVWLDVVVLFAIVVGVVVIFVRCETSNRMGPSEWGGRDKLLKGALSDFIGLHSLSPSRGSHFLVVRLYPYLLADGVLLLSLYTPHEKLSSTSDGNSQNIYISS